MSGSERPSLALDHHELLVELTGDPGWNGRVTDDSRFGGAHYVRIQDHTRWDRDGGHPDGVEAWCVDCRRVVWHGLDEATVRRRAEDHWGGNVWVGPL